MHPAHTRLALPLPRHVATFGVLDVTGAFHAEGGAEALSEGYLILSARITSWVWQRRQDSNLNLQKCCSILFQKTYGLT